MYDVMVINREGYCIAGIRVDTLTEAIEIVQDQGDDIFKLDKNGKVQYEIKIARVK